jgi:hypothetical protein
MRKQLILTLQIIVSALIGIEVSIPPNPYKNYLIISLTILICLKYNIIERIEDTMTTWLFNWREK